MKSKSRLRRYRNFINRMDGLLTRSAVITYGLGLPFVVMGTTSLSFAVTLSAGMLLVTLVSVLVAWGLKRLGQGREVCMLAAAFLSAVLLGVVSLTMGWTNRGVVFSVYFPLLAVNTLTFFSVTRCDASRPLLSVLLQALRFALSFGAVAAVIAAFRELIGRGTLFGATVFSSFRVPTVLLPFFGFILVGMVCAASRGLDRAIRIRCIRKDRDEAEQAAEEVGV